MQPKNHSHPISSDAIENHLSEFCSELERRLRRGADEYGDASFLRPCDALIGEIQEELLDICGWSFVAWCRLRRVREAIERADLDGHQAFDGSSDAA